MNTIKTMKATMMLFGAMATAALLAGCGEEKHEESQKWNNEIRLTSGVVTYTRADNASVPDTQIGENQVVKVVVAKQSDDKKDYEGYSLDFTADGNGGLSNSTPMYYPISGKGVSIYAYHPSTAGTSFSVKTDQSTDANYLASDLLYSKKKDYPLQAGAHSLDFVHKLSKVEYKLTAGEGLSDSDLKGVHVEWDNIATSIGFNTGTGAVATPTNSVAVVKPHAKYGAIIVPQTVEAEVLLIKVVLEAGTTLFYKTPKLQEFASGTKYTFNITVNLTSLTVKSTISDWTSVDINGGAGLQ